MIAAVRLAAAALLAAACAAPGAGRAAPAAEPPGVSPAPSSAAPIAVTVTASEYGHLVLATAPLTECSVRIHVGAPKYGDVPPAAVAGRSDASGGLDLRYPAPHLPRTTGWHEVRCGGATATADFSVPGTPLSAVRFSVRIRAAAADEQVTGVTARLDPAFVPARDRDVAALRGSLAASWRTATRGLSTLELTDGPADLVITVLPGRDTPVNVTATDGSQAIFLFVADQRTVFSSDNAVAIAMHELGHVWCCSGPDADGTGHWAVPVADPRLSGVDRFGLMNHPVQCVLSGAIESCPDRFSERELRAMGFSAIPAPR